MRQFTQQEYDSLVALAKFGRAVLSESGQLSKVWIVPYAVRHGLLTARDWEETDLAKLPEGL